MSRTDDQLRIRLPKALHDRVKSAAAANGRTMNSEINVALDGAYPVARGDEVRGLEASTTLRDRFAGQFLSGVAASDPAPLDVSPAADRYDVDAALRDYWGQVARAAYIAADAMIEARASKTDGKDE